jgi:hypothetical protein
MCDEDNNIKNIKIIGKTNIDKISKNKQQRLVIDKWKNVIDENIYNNIDKQKIILQELYLNNNDNDNKIYKILNREIKNKLNSYKYQDIQKKCYDNKYIIKYENIIELLVSSKLICHYCKEKTYLFYKKSYDQKQWTLDRIDNEQGHNYNNCVISCLKCNIQRKVMNKDKFTFSKQMKIKKI